MTVSVKGTVHVRIEEREGGKVAFLVIDNSSKLNTLNTGLMERFIAEVALLAEDGALRAVVLTGAGDKAFIGGADIFEMAGVTTPEQAEAFITLVHRTCRSLRDLPVPVIARIDGYALGAGLEVASACDLRVSSTRSVFGMPEVRVGIPSVVEAALLPGLIGWGRTRELLLLGENIAAEEAARWGLIERLVAPDALDDEVDRCLRALLSAGPQAIRLQKALMRQWEDLPLSEAVQAGIRSFARAWESAEPSRMMSAFTNRRRPG